MSDIEFGWLIGIIDGKGHKGHWGRIPTPDEVLNEFDRLRAELTELHGRQSKKLVKLKANA